MSIEHAGLVIHPIIAGDYIAIFILFVDLKINYEWFLTSFRSVEPGTVYHFKGQCLYNIL